MLSAIVVSGDITLRGGEDGFELFTNHLEVLAECCCPPENIIITPGNHDVTWYTDPGSPERYKFFLEHIRSKGYVTPLLDGIDIDPAGQNISGTGNKHVFMDPRKELVIIPINTCNYSGVRQTIDSITEEQWENTTISGLDAAKSKDVIKKLRMHDIARVSGGQLTAIRRLCNSEFGGVEPTIKIVVQHHHILPVSTTEEIKPFESITNLGLLRNFYRDYGINVVLHGHKHAGFLYWDHVYDFSSLKPSTPQKVLVVSGSTIGAPDSRKGEVCRLIEIRVNRNVPQVKIERIPVVEMGEQFRHSAKAILNLWGDEYSTISSSPIVLQGNDVDQAYDRLLSLFEDAPKGRVYNLLCIIKDPSGADEPRANYPETLKTQLPSLLRWWQRDKSQLESRLHFTHGSRIASNNQLRRVMDVLQQKQGTSRAVISLLNPKVDDVSDGKRRFPAFSLIQFIIREVGGEKRLDCMGYFRKQELKYWWPLNVAELRYLQKNVLQAIVHQYQETGLDTGSIILFSEMAYCSPSPPKAFVPEIDRIYDERHEELSAMAYAIISNSMPQREKYLDDLVRIIEELTPSETPDPDGPPVATEGIKFLLDQAKFYAKHGQSSILESFIDQLEELHQKNVEYDKKIASEDPYPETHLEWTQYVKERVDRITALVKSLANSSLR